MFVNARVFVPGFPPSLNFQVKPEPIRVKHLSKVGPWPYP